MCLWWPTTLLSSPVRTSLTDPILRIGVILPNSSMLTPYSDEILSGINIGLQSIKRSNKNLHSRIKIIKTTINRPSKKFGKKVQKFIEKNNIDVVMGGITLSTSIPIAKAMSSNPQPMVAFAPNLDIMDYKSTFKSCLTDTKQGKLVSKYSFNREKKRKAIIITDKSNNSFQDDISEFTRDFEARGGEILNIIYWKEINEQSLAESINNQKPDMIFLPDYFKNALHVSTVLKKQNLSTPIFGINTWDSPKLKDPDVNRIMAGNYFSTFFTPLDTNQTVRHFAENFQQLYQRNATSLAAIGFDSLGLVVKAFKAANSKLPMPLTKALKETHCTTFSTPTGNPRLSTSSIMIVTTKGPRFITRAPL